MAALHCSDLNAHEEEGVRQVLSAEWGMTLQSVFLYTTCYMLCCQHWFFFSLQQKKKINCKERQELFFILPRSTAGARMEEDNCGGRLADLLPSASPMPCCTEPMTKQACRNTGQTLRASYWDAESITAKKLLGKKASHFQILGFPSFPLIELYLLSSKMSRSHNRERLFAQFAKVGWLALQTNTLF